MIDRLINAIKEDERNWKRYQEKFVKMKVSSKTVLLHEGEISKNLFFIKEGCLREWFNKDGKDITFQFFFEGQAVASIDSFMNKKPSLFAIESIEPTIIFSITKRDFEELLMAYPKLEDEFRDLIFSRFRNYSQLFLSRIKDSPKERYEDLINNHPEIIRRVPQHYIASFLGITPISLSRIRNR